MTTWRRRLLRVVPLLAVAIVVVACTAGPASVVLPAGSSPPPPPPRPPANEVVIGVDDLPGGFNPHTVVDRTPTGTAVASLVFPSPFRQVEDGGWRLNTALLVSALVTDRDPFTVTYRIRDDAAWSNATPIAAEDFAYLAEQMRTEPGVVNAAGYELIDEVLSADGGKTVQVIFTEPYPAWRSLFRHLLPAHLLKDAPGGWAHALNNGVPVSGGPFVLVSVDPARRQLVLERNDRYWGPPARLDRIVLRQIPPAGLVDALQAGGVTAALFTDPDQATLSMLAATRLPEPKLVVRPVLARLVLRPPGGQLASRTVRAAVAASLDRDSLLAVAGADDLPADLVADAQVLAPSQPGYSPTLPRDGLLTGNSSAPAQRLLTEAGYERGPQGWRRNGEVLTLEVAAPSGRSPYSRIAHRVAVQLRSVGIRVTLRTMPGDELVTALAENTRNSVPTEDTETAGARVTRTSGSGTDPTPRPDDGQGQGGSAPREDGIDIAVLGQPVGSDPATVLASVHGCPIEMSPGEELSPVGLVGFCEPALQPLIEAALTGAKPADAVLADVADDLWQRLVSIPLYQHASLLVTRPELAGVHPGSLLEGPLHRAVGWHLRAQTPSGPP